MNERGQILLPALAWYLGLLIVFCGLITWGNAQLRQERMDMAASAAAISSARALASQLNECATQNMEANGFVNLRYGEFGAMQAAAVEEFEAWLELHQAERTMGNFQAVLNGFKGNATAVGSQVAKLNGATRAQSRSSLSLRLQLHDLDIFILDGLIPFPVPITFPGVFYKRLWGYNARKAQPPHEAIWVVADGRIQSTAAARVYLDVVPSERFQNGGFPREQGEDIKGKFEILSLYPQFNAKLIPVPLLNRVVNWVIS